VEDEVVLPEDRLHRVHDSMKAARRALLLGEFDDGELRGFTSLQNCVDIRVELYRSNMQI